ncbi:MAG TPA: thioredoxin family protein [Desulfomonilaceae bacterium]|nr:thioredoxin family protein [Desulfomonilaceae bacterium]
MASVLKEVADETKGKAIVGLVMVSDRELVQAFGIKKIPTVFVMRNAEVTASFVGVLPKAQIQKLLKGT